MGRASKHYHPGRVVTDWKIVQALPSDAEAMRNCVRRAYTHYVERIGKEPGPMVDDYPARIANDQAYVLRAGDALAGVLVLVVEPGRLLLDNVAVDPDYSGQGLGRQLMVFAEARTRELGYDEIELYTHELMTENIEMYRRWGYQILRRIHEKGFDRVYMGKKCREPE